MPRISDRQPAQHVLGQVHEIPVVGVRLVELQHRELGVVSRGQPLVAEVAVDLVDLLEAADHQPLQIELRRDPQVQLHVERVVMGDERPRGRAARDHLHHRCLDLEEAAPVQVAADELNHPGARLEGAPRRLVHDQVEVALPVAALLVGEAVELLRQGPQRLGEQAQFVAVHRQLAGLGLEQPALGADDVAEVPVALELLVDPVRERVALHVELNAARHVLDVDEAGLAHHAPAHDPPGDPHPDGQRLQLLGRPAAVLGVQLARDDVAPEVVRKGDALLAQPGELLAALRDELVLVGGRDVVGHDAVWGLLRQRPVVTGPA